MRLHQNIMKCWIPVAVLAALVGKLAVCAQECETVDDFAPDMGVSPH